MSSSVVPLPVKTWESDIGVKAWQIKELAEEGPADLPSAAPRSKGDSNLQVPPRSFLCLLSTHSPDFSMANSGQLDPGSAHASRLTLFMQSPGVIVWSNSPQHRFIHILNACSPVGNVLLGDCGLWEVVGPIWWKDVSRNRPLKVRTFLSGLFRHSELEIPLKEN